MGSPGYLSDLRRKAQGDAFERASARLLIFDALTRAEGRKELAAPALGMSVVTLYRVIWDVDAAEPGGGTPFQTELGRRWPELARGGAAWAAATKRRIAERRTLSR